MIGYCARKECGEKFESSYKKTYCSRTCAAKVNNVKYPKRSPEGSCLECGAKIASHIRYCPEHKGMRQNPKFKEKREAISRDVDWLMERIAIDKNTGCWNWQKSLFPDGYGRVGDPPHTTHALSYSLMKGKVPEGLVVRHLCHNPKCCNPDHLEVGTHKDNYHDSIDVHRESAIKRRGSPSKNRVPIIFRGKRYDSKSQAVADCGVTWKTVTAEGKITE